MNEKKYANAILILFAHPALQKSRVNIRLIPYVQAIEGVTFHDLYEVYPDFHIQVPHEQEQLMKHDIILKTAVTRYFEQAEVALNVARTMLLWLLYAHRRIAKRISGSTAPHRFSSDSAYY